MFLILFVVFVMFLLRDNALFLLCNRIVDWIEEEEEEDIVEVIIVYSYSSFVVSSLFSVFNNEVYICYIYIYILSS